MITTNVYIGTSLDGFIARKNGSFDWLSDFGDQDALDAYKSFMADIDVIVIGRHTFETVLKFPFWPYERPVVVLTKSLSEVPTKANVKDVSLTRLGPKELLLELSEKGFRSAYIDGGKVIQSFLADDLVDELIIARVPTLLGDGIPLFGKLNQDLRFKHRRTTSFSNGLVRSYYTRQRY